MTAISKWIERSIGYEKSDHRNCVFRCLLRGGSLGSESGADPQKHPTKIWNRTGPLGETPKHVTDAYPLSDQQNKGGWVKFEPMSDEFEGKELDLKSGHWASVGGRAVSPPCSATRT